MGLFDAHEWDWKRIGEDDYDEVLGVLRDMSDHSIRFGRALGCQLVKQYFADNGETTGLLIYALDGDYDLTDEQPPWERAGYETREAYEQGTTAKERNKHRMELFSELSEVFHLRDLNLGGVILNGNHDSGTFGFPEANGIPPSFHMCWGVAGHTILNLTVGLADRRHGEDGCRVVF